MAGLLTALMAPAAQAQIFPPGPIVFDVGDDAAIWTALVQGAGIVDSAVHTVALTASLLKQGYNLKTIMDGTYLGENQNYTTTAGDLTVQVSLPSLPDQGASIEATASGATDEGAIAQARLSAAAGAPGGSGAYQVAQGRTSALTAFQTQVSDQVQSWKWVNQVGTQAIIDDARVKNDQMNYELADLRLHEQNAINLTTENAQVLAGQLAGRR